MIRRDILGGLLALLVPRMEYVFPRHIGELYTIYGPGVEAFNAIAPPSGEKSSVEGFDGIFLSHSPNFGDAYVAALCPVTDYSRYPKMSDFYAEEARLISPLVCRKAEAGAYVDGRWIQITNDEGTMAELHRLSGVIL